MTTRERLISQMPDSLRTAQEAIALPEVQEIIKKLAKYNLGVFMPHAHTAEEDFAELPGELVQVEEDLKVSFHPRTAVDNVRTVPVAWKWVNDGVSVGSVCVSYCVATSRQSGGQDHKSLHSKG